MPAVRSSRVRGLRARSRAAASDSPAASTEAGLQALYDAKAHEYAAFGNGLLADEVARLLPEGGAVLDVGCAAGGLLELLRDRAGRTVGVELSPTAAAAAAGVADEVVIGSAEDPDLPLPREAFDVVVLGDVLEHLIDPEAALRRAVGWARPRGAVVLSVPNIAHWQARLVVARGRWPVEASGTFDATHLRFFTVDRARMVAGAAGLDDVRLRPVVPRLRNHLSLVARLPVAAGERVEGAWQQLGRRRPNLLGYQLVVSGRRPG